MKLLCLIACMASASAFANPVWDDDMSGPKSRNFGMLCSLVTAGGGEDRFDTRHALNLAMGNDKAQQEYDRLAAQFGEGKVYKFFAINDTLMKEGLAAMALHSDDYYTPRGYDESMARSYIRMGMNNEDYFSSERQLDKLFGPALHGWLMKSIEWRYGADATHDYHMIMDQMVLDVAPQVGIANIKIMPSSG